MYFCDIQYNHPKIDKKDFFSNICRNVLILRQNLRILLPKPTMACLLLVFWLLGFSITCFVIKIFFTLTLELTFLTFVFYFILKLYIFVNVFIQSLAKSFRNVLHILFRILLISIFYCFVFFSHYIVNMYFCNFFLKILTIYFIFYFHVQLVLMLTKI